MISKEMVRDLARITGELHAVMTRESKDIIEIGSLLIEAREQLDHGEWLPWLTISFSMSVRSAENYMAAARFAAKFATVANLGLRLRPSALYVLGYHYIEDEEVVAAVLAEAVLGWVSGHRVHEIADGLKPDDTEIAEEMEAEEERDAAEQEEIDEILDGAPPELPPAPDATVHDVLLPPFDGAIKTLIGLQTKPLGKFADTAHTPGDIRAVSTFLREVADAIEGKSRPQAA